MQIYFFFHYKNSFIDKYFYIIQYLYEKCFRFYIIFRKIENFNYSFMNHIVPLKSTKIGNYKHRNIINI